MLTPLERLTLKQISKKLGNLNTMKLVSDVKNELEHNNIHGPGVYAIGSAVIDNVNLLKKEINEIRSMVNTIIKTSK